MDRRIRWLGAFLLLCFLVLFLQLNNIQIREAAKYADDPANPRVALQAYTEPRGTIQTADGTTLAVSVPNTDPRYPEKYERTYPTGGLFEQVVGYDSPVYGLTGVEAYYDSYLVAHSRPIKTLSDILANRTVVGNVTLTLSDTLQAEAQKALGSQPGSVVAINPTTGAILAMYSNPSFDPTGLASFDAATEKAAWAAGTCTACGNDDTNRPLLTRAYQEYYPPGSTFKVVTSAAVYDHDPSLATKSYPVVSDIPLPDTSNTLHNYHYEVCGGTLQVMLPQSCDTGYGQIGLDLADQNLGYLPSEAQAFGFNQVPPLDMDSGQIAATFPAAAWFTLNRPVMAYAAIGQDVVDATPLQMALVAAGIADDGQIMTPHVMAQIRDSQGNLEASYQPKVWLQATSAATAAQVRNLMLGVVTSGTADKVGFPAQDDVAAKTGTAQVGLSNELTTDWMIALAPAGANDVPQVAIAVVLPDEPATATGAEYAGPVMLQMIEAALAQASPST